MEDYDGLSLNTIIRYIVLTAVGIILIYPLLWMIGSAFKNNIDIFGNFSLFPPRGRGTLENWSAAWNINSKHNLGFYFVNTLKFLVPKTIFTVASCTLTAYIIARKNFYGKKFVFTAVIITLLMPETAFRIPLYLLFTKWGLVDKFMSLWIMDVFATASFFIFMEIQFMRTIPKELDEAAKIDGCGTLKTLWYITIPIIKPIVITVALLCFMWGMNDFQGPLIYLNSPDKATMSIILKQQLDGDSQIVYGKIFAASTIALMPMIAIFFAGSKYFVDGVANSGGKE